MSPSLVLAVGRVSDRTARSAPPRGHNLWENVQKNHARISHEFEDRQESK
jgi:hypothetical protein